VSEHHHKPCPWCGTKEVRTAEALGGAFQAVCGEVQCQACGPVAGDRHEALVAWDRRTSEGA
jgi:hypothetical protein